MVSASTLVTSDQTRSTFSKPCAGGRAPVDHPGDEGQRQQRDQRQPGVDREQDDRRHRDHQHVGGEVEQVHGQEQADAVGLGADARHQVAGALAAEVLQRQPSRCSKVMVRRSAPMRSLTSARM
jgi:hypothetical protein